MAFSFKKILGGIGAAMLGGGAAGLAAFGLSYSTLSPNMRAAAAGAGGLALGTLAQMAESELVRGVGAAVGGGGVALAAAHLAESSTLDQRLAGLTDAQRTAVNAEAANLAALPAPARTAAELLADRQAAAAADAATNPPAGIPYGYQRPRLR